CILSFLLTALLAIYTLSLHDALPISVPAPPARHQAHVQLLLDRAHGPHDLRVRPRRSARHLRGAAAHDGAFAHEERDLHHRRARSEEHTSELQSRENLVCRLLLEKKK